MLIRKLHIHKFPWCPTPQISNPQICKKKAVFHIQISIGLPLIFSYLRRNILDYEMPCNSKLSQKPGVVLKSECQHFKLIFVRIKSMYLRICGSLQICGFAICGTYLRTTHLCVLKEEAKFWKLQFSVHSYQFILPYIINSVRDYVQGAGSTLAGCILSGNQD
jgi:hypothetical protein